MTSENIDMLYTVFPSIEKRIHKSKEKRNYYCRRRCSLKCNPYDYNVNNKHCIRIQFSTTFRIFSNSCNLFILEKKLIEFQYLYSFVDISTIRTTRFLIYTYYTRISTFVHSAKIHRNQTFVFTFANNKTNIFTIAK